MKAFNVLHVVSKLSASGGIGNQLLALLRKYKTETLIPVVCSLSGRGPIAKEMEALGVEVISLGIDFKKGFYPGAVKRLYDLIREKNIRILRCHGYRSSMHGVPAGSLLKVPCIVTSFHNIYMPRDRKLNRRLTNKFLSYFTDRVITVSETVKDDVMRYDMVPEKKITVIHNGVKAERFINVDAQNIKKEFGIQPSAPVIGTVGRLFKQKGQKYLIEALPILKNDFPDIKLLIAGDGPLRNELSELTEKLGLKENVIFTGARRDIPELISAMDIFVFPSLWEGFGNVLIEAMAAGRPIVASDIPPAREIAGSGDQAVIVPPKDYSAIAGAVKNILTDRRKAERMAESARKRALSSFTIDITYQKYKELYLEILKEKGVV